MKRVVLDWIDPRYSVAADGSVWSTCDSHGGVAPVARTLKGNVINSGYMQYRLPVDGKWKWVSASRLILRAFTGVEGEECNHRDGNRLNNALSNLEWCTRSENMRHSYRVLGRVHPRPALGKFGVLNSCSKRVLQLTPAGDVVKVWDALQDAARAGFHQGNIGAVCAGKRRSHAGYIWKFDSQQGK